MCCLLLSAIVVLGAGIGSSAQAAMQPQEVVRTWYRLILELVRHTPTYSPPVASRTFAYVGVAAFESVASGSPHLQTLAGQLNGLQPVPQRIDGAAYDEAVILHSLLAKSVKTLFANTGPTGQRAMGKLDEGLRKQIGEDLSPEVVTRSRDYGEAVASHILEWAKSDGGAVVENMGFPLSYELTKGPAHWVPTSLVAQQQVPLLPQWGRNRTFAMPDGAACPLPPPPEFSEAPGSAFYKEAREVYDVTRSMTAEQVEIARFWSDDPMLSSTPPGHWISIALQVAERESLDLETTAEMMARLGITLSDAFVACWWAKFEFDLVRPITYIRRLIDPQWDALLNTPPFPEYPSGHSTQSAAAATVLAAMFGENYAFEDKTKTADGMKPRKFASFWAAADEAGISRLYGGIHFRAAIERGLAQGRCVGAHTNALKTRS